MNTTPLSQKEYENLFKILDLVSTNIDRLLNQGVLVVNENLDDEQIHSSRRNIESFREKIRKEQDRIRRVRDHLQRRTRMDRNSK